MLGKLLEARTSCQQLGAHRREVLLMQCIAEIGRLTHAASMAATSRSEHLLLAFKLKLRTAWGYWIGLSGPATCSCNNTTWHACQICSWLMTKACCRYNLLQVVMGVPHHHHIT